MAPRFPLDEAPHPDARRVTEEALSSMHGGQPPFQWIEEDGRSLVGCYAPLSYTPHFMDKFFILAKAAHDPSVVNPRYRELAILGLSSVLDVPYITYCHRDVAARVGITQEQYEAGSKGNVPQDLTDGEVMAYRLGQILTTLTHQLNDETWQEALSKMSKSELVGILHIVAGYRWVAMLEQVNGDSRKWA